jgi:hypothetical protein
LTGDLDDLLPRTRSDNADNLHPTAPVTSKGEPGRNANEARPR